MVSRNDELIYFLIIVNHYTINYEKDFTCRIAYFQYAVCFCTAQSGHGGEL